MGVGISCTSDLFISFEDSGPAPDFKPCPDSDGDGIPDEQEGAAQGTDTDGDGTPDYKDLDSDDDTIPDSKEALMSGICGKPSDNDGDGKPNFQDKDSDGNGILDKEEGTEDPDKDGIPNFADTDDDGDNIGDKEEIGSNPAKPTNTDGDSLPDYRDTDSDGDGIPDVYETGKDTDGDGYPNYQDQDSDNDTIPDSKEKGSSGSPPADTDKDGIFDFLDLDSDADGLSDEDEVTKFKTDPTNPDTDGDGINDMIETLDPKYDPLDPKKNPKVSGDFVFIMTYNKPPTPPKDTLDFSTDISQADVFFVVDTTGSMKGEISNLITSLNTIITSVNKVIPSTAFGVARYEDFPYGNYGKPGDVPFGLLHRVMTVKTSPGIASVKARVNALSPAYGGADGPESGWEAMYQTATGKGVKAGNVNVPPFNTATAYPATPPAGESHGTIGGAGFRKGSMPIVVWASDASSHNPGGYSSYAFGGSANSTLANAELKKIGARVIGVLSSGGYAMSQARNDLIATAVATGAVVPPSAFGGAGTRPSGCATTKCCTGYNGAGENVGAGGLCPLVFTINGSGAGLGDSAIKGIQKLVAYAKIDITSVGIDDTTDTVDAIKSFVQSIAVHNTTSATPKCTGGLQVADQSPGGDGILDTFKQVIPATPVCFDVTAKMNTTVKPKTVPQLFRAFIEVLGDGKAKLSKRQVFFVVPPEIPKTPNPG